MDRSEKEALVAELKSAFEESAIVLVSRQSGMTVTEAQNLRARMREAGAKHRVVKNRLVKIAAEGGEFDDIRDMLTGPTSISYSDDPVGPAKALAEFAKDIDKIEILGGAMDGKVLSAAEVEQLAKLPSLDQLRAQIIGLLNAPASKIVGVVDAPAAKLARVFAAYGAKEDA
mgnify:FL=1